MSDSKGLKDCPFCGGKASMEYSESDFAGESDQLSYLTIECMGCQARGPRISLGMVSNPVQHIVEKGVSYLIKHWNGRVGE